MKFLIGLLLMIIGVALYADNPELGTFLGGMATAFLAEEALKSIVR